MESQARNLIGNGTTIKGDIESNGDIRIDGVSTKDMMGPVGIGNYMSEVIDEAEEQGGSILVFILVVVIAAVAAVGGMALSMLIRKR